MNRLAACCCALLITTAADSLLADNWPQFRGPGGLGVSEERGLPARWSTTENIAWKTALPGPGSSSPIVWGDRIFITCYSGYGLDESNPGNPDNLKRHLLCIQRMDGKINWDRTVNGAAAIPFDGFQALHGYASSTPATDGTLVYVFFEKEGVFAFDYSGQQVWRSSVGEQTHSWGSGTSPVLYENLVIVNASVEDGSLVALDRKTGKEAWRARGMQESWSTPLLVGAVVISYGNVEAFRITSVPARWPRATPCMPLAGGKTQPWPSRLAVAVMSSRSGRNRQVPTFPLPSFMVITCTG